MRPIIQRISHLTNDVDRLDNQYYQNIIGILEVVLTLLVTIIVLLSIWWKFIFVIVAMMFVFVMMARKSSEPVKKKRSRNQFIWIGIQNLLKKR